MFGFKEKKEEDTMALVLKKENIFLELLHFLEEINKKN